MEERVPEIRFKGFEEQWKIERIGEIMNVTSVKRIHQSDWTDHGVRFLRARDIVTELKNEEQAECLFISKEKYDEYSSISGKVQPGDLLVTGVGTIGVPYLIKDANPVYFKDGNIIWFQNRSCINGKFLFYSFLSKTIQDYITESAGIGTVGTYTIESGKKTPLFHPCKMEEQECIGNLLNNLDTLISLTQQKLTQLKTFKKSCLEKMFPKDGEAVPEVRFEGFEGPWEKRKLSDLATMHARIGWQNLRTSEFMDNGDYLLITGTDFMDGRIDFSSCHYVKKERYEQDRNIQIGNGSILITKDGTLGKVAFVQGLPKPATLNAGVFNVTVKDETLVSNKYMFQYLKAPFLMDYVNKRATGGTIKHLNQNLLVDFPVVIPSKEEQEMIGLYLNNLDTLITLQQQKLEKLKNLKKALLDKMFI